MIVLRSFIFKNFSRIQKPNQIIRTFCDSTTSKTNFMAHYPYFVEEMKDIIKNYDPLEQGKHIERILDYNISGGKTLRANMIAAAFKELAPSSLKTEESIKSSIYLGWCYESIHGSLLSVDDIIDGSATRRGRPCWYKQQDIQLTAINDALLIETVLFAFMKKNFEHMQSYVNLIESLRKNILILAVGEYLDTATAHQDVRTFTMDQFRKIVSCKSSHYTIYTPIELAKYLAGNEDFNEFQASKDLLYEMGIFYQTQDDFLDCYGDPAVTGKEGTDIQVGKCTWLVVTFLNRANASQKAILKKFYGKKDEESVQRVKKLYDEVGLPEAYANYEEYTYKMIKDGIEEAKGIPKKVCQDFMDKLYKRKL